MLELSAYIYLMSTFILFAIGLYILVAKKNIIRMVLGVEVMVTAANMAFIILSGFLFPGSTDPLAQAIVIISIGIGAGVATIALILAVMAYRKYGTLDITKLRELKG
ncbi:MAG: NADH-quinone oxidoreductase subunit NuoK [Candidatus Njordarchaeia archaeon]|nr:NADH-quinone oxidoreductase subunit K [Candidatus Korarchaeota archaeon]